LSLTLSDTRVYEPQIRALNRATAIDKMAKMRNATWAPMYTGPERIMRFKVHIPPSHGARPVHLIITMIKWFRTSRLSIKNSLSWQSWAATNKATKVRDEEGIRLRQEKADGFR